MRRAERAAWYVMTRKRNGLHFLNYNFETREKRLTSCPHDATLFTSMVTAAKFADDLRTQIGGTMGDGTTGAVPTRTNAPNVLTGAFPKEARVKI